MTVVPADFKGQRCLCKVCSMVACAIGIKWKTMAFAIGSRLGVLGQESDMTAKKRLPKGFAELDVGALSESDRMNILMLAEKAAVYGATKRQTLGNPQQTKAFVSAQLRSKQSEVFLVIFLDSQHGVLASEEMFQGTIDGCSVYPREVVKRALEVNAAALVLAHPHPSGEPEPS